jgi:hypothetical protein
MSSNAPNTIWNTQKMIFCQGIARKIKSVKEFARRSIEKVILLQWLRLNFHMQRKTYAVAVQSKNMLLNVSIKSEILPGVSKR